MERPAPHTNERGVANPLVHSRIVGTQTLKLCVKSARSPNAERPGVRQYAERVNKGSSVTKRRCINLSLTLQRVSGGGEFAAGTLASAGALMRSLPRST